MKTGPWKYSYQVCPFCKSKKITGVTVEYREDDTQKYGFLCDKCGRFHEESKWIYDRAEMRRDANKLLKFLGIGE